MAPQHPHNPDTPAKERIVVIGGGFAGLTLAKKIDKKKFDVTIIDTNNYHSFPPLFYQIASSGVDPTSICFPFRRELRKGSVRGAKYRLGFVKTIDFAARKVHTQYETVPYDKLVIAAGTTNNFFGNDELLKTVYTIKSAPEAIRCRDEILLRMERASLSRDKDFRRRMLTFTVIGGGPTGVEIAGALGEMKRYILKREYPGIAPEEVNIRLLEGNGRLLGGMSPRSSEKAGEYLQKLMVDVRLNTLMKSYEGDTLTLSDGTVQEAGMVIWTAGITAMKFELTGGNPQMGPGGRFTVDRSCRIAGVSDAYALGDIAFMTTEASPKGLPQLAQVAIQQARHLATELNTGRFSEFNYHDKGSMATVGRNLAVADLPHGHLCGFIAWVAWMFVHLISILGMRNKLTVLITWIWSYCSYPTSLRLIMRPSKWPLTSSSGKESALRE